MFRSVPDNHSSRRQPRRLFAGATCAFALALVAGLVTAVAAHLGCRGVHQPGGGQLELNAQLLDLRDGDPAGGDGVGQPHPHRRRRWWRQHQLRVGRDRWERRRDHHGTNNILLTHNTGAVSVKLGCGGSGGTTGGGGGTTINGASGGAGFAAGGSSGGATDEDVSVDGVASGGGGGGATGLCLGTTGCTTPVAVASGGGGGGARWDCTGSTGPGNGGWQRRSGPERWRWWQR